MEVVRAEESCRRSREDVFPKKRDDHAPDTAGWENNLVRPSDSKASACSSDTAARVCMIVYNSVSHDARVLKQAGSLHRAGYDVNIIALADNRDSRAESIVAGGVKVTRLNAVVPQRVRAVARMARTWTNFFKKLVRRRIMLLMLVGATAALLYRGPDFWITLYHQHTGDVLLAWNLLLTYVVARLAVKRPLTPRLMMPCMVPRWFLLKLYRVRRFRIWQKAVLRELRKVRPSVVHCHDWHTLEAGARYKQQSGCALIYDSHELPEHQGGVTASQAKRVRRRQRNFSPWVDGFITVNDRIGDYFKDHYPKLPPATIVMNATAPRSAPPTYDGRLHDAAVLPPSKKILLFQGGFATGRGLPTLLEAAALLPDDWALVMMGGGAFEAKLRRIAARLAGGSEKIRFILPAPQEELAYWTAGASIGAIPYENTCLNHWFCSPNKLWEYPNAGVPILASRFPVMEEIITSYDIGWLVDAPVKPHTIADMIAGISEEELARKKRNCQRYVCENNWSTYEKRLLELYHKMGSAVH